MKKTFALILSSLALFASLAGCQKDQGPTQVIVRQTIIVMATHTFTKTPAPALPTATHTQIYAVPTAGPEMIDNLSNCDVVNLWGGYWWTGCDASSVVWPPNLSFTGSSPGLDAAYDCAARMTGSAAGGGYMGMGTGLSADKDTNPVDISMYEGIKFWAKGNGQNYNVKFAYLDNSGAALDGWNNYKFTFTAGASWTQVTVPFSSLTQGTGTIVALDDVLQNARHIEFSPANVPLNVDLWIDNIEVYGTAPTRTQTASPTDTSTATITPTFSHTATSTITLTATKTPFILDNFEDGDYVNNIDPPLNMWHSFDASIITQVKPGGPAGSSYYLSMSGTVNPSTISSSGCGPTATVQYSMKFLPTKTLNFSGQALDLSGFTHLSFYMRSTITANYAATCHGNTPDILIVDTNNTTCDIPSSIFLSNPPDATAWKKYCAPLASLSCSAAVDLSHIQTLALYYYIAASGCPDCAMHYRIDIDNVMFCNSCP